MGYANAKGAEGEREAADYYNNVFQDFGYKFMRIGGTEKSKKVLFGDVILDKRSDPKDNCFLSQYFLEVKKRATINVFDIIEEATQNAETYGRSGAIAYVIKQGKGHHRDGEVIVMSKEVFKRISVLLQGYINQSNEKEG